MHILAAIWLKAIKRYARNSLFEPNQFSMVNQGNERRKAKKKSNTHPPFSVKLSNPFFIRRTMLYLFVFIKVGCGTGVFGIGDRTVPAAGV